MADITVVLKLDAENKKLVGKVLNSAGADVYPWGSIHLELGKDPGTLPNDPGTTMGLELKLREWRVCDVSGNTKYALFLSSAVYDNPKTASPL